MTFSVGMSGHYFVLSGGGGCPLIWRMGDPGKCYPQIVEVYNPITVVAFVLTDKNQAMDQWAFKLLLENVTADLHKADLALPKYLLR